MENQFAVCVLADCKAFGFGIGALHIPCGNKCYLAGMDIDSLDFPVLTRCVKVYIEGAVNKVAALDPCNLLA